MARFTAGYLHLRQGEFDRAVALLERGLTLCRAVEMPAQLTLLLSTLGYARVLQGRFAEGLFLLKESVEPSTFNRSAPFSFLSYSWARLDFWLGRSRGGPERAAGARASQESGERGWEAWSLRLLGDSVSHSEPSDIAKAGHLYQESLTLADELGMRPLVAHCHLGRVAKGRALSSLCRTMRTRPL